MQILLYNSLSNSIEPFIPLDANNVRVYACGPTVYASPHIGNARPLVVFDVLLRLLKRQYKKVTYVRNITDVDDKINQKAYESGVSIQELTNKVIDEFHESLALLNVLPATCEPKATEHIPEMLTIIDKLITNEFAYEAEGHVLFRVEKMLSYGCLSKQCLKDMIAGSRIEVASYKENPMDFVLWKPSDEHTISWPSKFGNGRPGWHIECSAMSAKYLGDYFDIHAGGHDLMFPHHENEIAQNFGAFGKQMANYWVHNGMLLVDNQKMSKSSGNIIALNAILKEFDGEVVRLALLSAHYHKTLNWTEQNINQAKQSLNRLYGALRRASSESLISADDVIAIENPVVEALCSNLNTPLAIHCLHSLADQIFKENDQLRIDSLCEQLRSDAALMGLLAKKSDDWFVSTVETHMSDVEILDLIKKRKAAKEKCDFALADKIRDDLSKRGIQIEDNKVETTWRCK